MLPPFPPEIISLILHYVLLPTSPSSSPDRSPSFHPLRSEAQTDFLFSLNSLSASPNWAKPAGDRLWRDLHVGVKQEAHSIISALKQDRNRLGNTKRGTAGKVKVLHLEIKQYLEPQLFHSGLSTSTAFDSDFSDQQPDGVTPSQIRELASLLPSLSTICIRATMFGASSLNTEICDALKSFVGRKEFKHLEFDSHFLGIGKAIDLLLHAPFLETLKMKDLGGSTNWTALRLNPNCLSNLTSLTLSRCYMDIADFTQILQQVRSPRLALRTLILHELRSHTLEKQEPQPFSYSARELRLIYLLLPYLTHFHLVLAPRSEPVHAEHFAPHFCGHLKKLVLGGDNFHFQSPFFKSILDRPAFRPTSLTLFPLASSCGINLIELGKILQDAWADDLVLLDLEGAREATDSLGFSTGAREGERWLSGGMRYIEERVERVNRARREEGKRELILRI